MPFSRFIHSAPPRSQPGRPSSGRVRGLGEGSRAAARRGGGPARPRPSPQGRVVGLRDLEARARDQNPAAAPQLLPVPGRRGEASAGRPPASGEAPPSRCRPGCPAGSRPAPPPQRPTSLAAAAQTPLLSALPRASLPRSRARAVRATGERQGWRCPPRRGGAHSPGRNRRPPAEGGYLDDPAGQPGHLVRSRVRPLLSSPAPLASRTSGSPGLYFRGTLPRPPPPPRPLGKCSPGSDAGGLPSARAPSPEFPAPTPAGGGWRK